MPVSQGGDIGKLSDDQLQDVSGGFEIVVAVTIATSIAVGMTAVGAVAAGMLPDKN